MTTQMKKIIVLFLTTLCTACYLHDNITAQLCNEEIRYEHKTEAEIATMTSEQLINESVQEQLHHKFSNWTNDSHDRDYGFVLGSYIHKKGIEVLPVLTKYINAYDPKNSSKCEKTRFEIASHTLSGIDYSIIRLRGISDGQAAIEALSNAVELMKRAGFENGGYENRSEIESATLDLKEVQGVTIIDSDIQNTLRVQHNIQLTDAELLEFSNFLVALDPSYPRWSEPGDYGPPRLLKDSKKYLDAYRKFKKQK